MMQAMTHLGNRLRQARATAKLSQEALAETLGIARTNYIPFETGRKKPGIELLQRIAEILKVPAIDLEAALMADEKPKDVIAKAHELLQAQYLAHFGGPDQFSEENDALFEEVARRRKEKENK